MTWCKRASVLFFSFFICNVVAIFINNHKILPKCSVLPFSCVHSKFFKEHDFKDEKGNLRFDSVWIEKAKMPFRELILSWNAFRPKKGKFVFYISFKYKGWTRFFRFAEWGTQSQQTFVNTKNRFLDIRHVRAHTKYLRRANAFRVKVEAQDGADLRLVKALFVCITQGPGNLKIKQVNTKKLQNVWVKGVPRQSQMVLKHKRKGDMCSPTSVSMLVSYFLKDRRISSSFVGGLRHYVPRIAKKIHDDSYLDTYGNWVLNVAQAFDSAKGKVFFRAERLNDFNHLYKYLQHDVPVALSVRGRSIRNGAKPYSNGHFIVVIGFNNKRNAVICLDPAFKGSKRILKGYKLDQFLRAWGSSGSPNLCYVPIPRKLVSRLG
jgi:hypothetical protein